MLNKIFSPNPFKTFYIVFAYILIFSVWWAYLLFEKNETAFKEKIELNEIRYYKTEGSGDYKTTDEYHEINVKFNRQRLMIITEGSVFILLLLGGLLRVRKVFRDEIRLAEQQKNFLLSVTHELKSPLSTIKLSLQTLSKRKLEAEQTDKLINNSLVDLDRLETLVENILFAAKIERNEPGFSNEAINVSGLTQRIVESFSNNKKSVTIQACIDPDIYAKLDAIGFASVVTNLIENAIKYTEPKTQVELRLEQNGADIFLQIADNGIGIPDADKKKVFEKFYRVGNENTRKTKGTGLGLYIVKRFVEIYGGDIVVEDNLPQGSVFNISLPSVI